MAKFNKPSPNISENSTNLEDFPSFDRTDFKKEVVSVILNSLLKGDSYYESEEERIKKIQNYISTKPELGLFLAKAMVYTRTVANLRSVSCVLAISLVENIKSSTFLKPALYKTIIRPDDATEMVALWNSKHPKVMVPNSLRRAIKMTLEDKFTAYSLKKYFGTGAVKVSDLIKLTHPTPSNSEKAVVFKQAIEGTLPKIDTAQTVNASLVGESRLEMYNKMLKEGSLGYMAALKNIKNILETVSGDSKSLLTETINLWCDLISNQNAVMKSKILPFRFYDAYRMVGTVDFDLFEIKKIQGAIETAFIYSSGNVNILEDNETCAILLDESGSMGSNDYKSPFQTGLVLMASMLVGIDKNRALGYLWSDSTRRVDINTSPMEFIKKTKTQGGGTNLGASISDLISTNTKVDKLIIFTDMQQNQIRYGSRYSYTFHEMVSQYREISPSVKVLFWNLEGYGGATPMKLNEGILEVSGFSDRMLEIIPKLWNDEGALIDEIENINI